MPVLHVLIIKDAVIVKPKRHIVSEITPTPQAVRGKRPEHTCGIIDESHPDNWGFAATLTTEWRQQQQQQ